MTPALSFVANHLWQSTLFAAAAWLLTLVLTGNHASVRYWIWLSASLKFLLPFSLLISAGSWFGAYTPAPGLPATVSAVLQQAAEPFVGVETHSVDAGPIETAPSAVTGLLPVLAVLAWFGGCAGVLICWGRRWRRVSEALRSAEPFPAGRFQGVDVVASRSIMEPGVVGILRPVLLVPAGVTRLLNEEQLRAVIAHEVVHVRRRDNLTSALHMLVEATFWFHPLVWWLGARLIDERENACDEEVLRMGNDPQSYAEGILKVCEFYVKSPLACASGITSSNLKKRVEEIMLNRVGRPLDFGRKLILTGAALAAIAGPVGLGILHAPRTFAQTSAGSSSATEFEVASVKANTSGSTASRASIRNERVAITNATLEQIMMYAYKIRDYQISGPGWMKTDRYDIVAKAESGTPDSRLPRMLQTLLADRFKMKVRRDTKDLPIYALVVGKTGPKLKKHTEETVSGSGSAPNRGGGMSAGAAGLQSGGGPPMRTHQSIGPLSSFAAGLSQTLDRPVLDMTGLSGNFDIKLVYLADADLPAGSPANSAPSSVFTAVQEQLGLRLEARNGPVEVFVIETVERPSENQAIQASIVPAAIQGSGYALVIATGRPRLQASRNPEGIQSKGRW